MIDTIFALSSGRPSSGVAVIRISGPQAFATLDQLVSQRPAPRHATLRTLRDPVSGQPLDSALVLSFTKPASATGEDVVELHLHGGMAVVAAVLAVLARSTGLRMAERGEFTRRAFDNGRMDLSQAEGLADLIAAETEVQRRAALRQADGGLRDRVEGWRAALISLCAQAEAGLDFAEEEADVADSLSDGDLARMADLGREMAEVLADANRGLRIRDGLVVTIIGAPNVGKSSLINRLSGTEAAIVSEFAGTTRDLIELPLNLDGMAITLIDTAGLRETSDPVEAEGIRRARNRAASADLILHIAEHIPEVKLGQLVINKIDQSSMLSGYYDGNLHISATSGAGVPELVTWLRAWAAAAIKPEEPVLITKARHRAALETAASRLAEAATQLDAVLRAESLRLATRALGKISGRVDVEEVLDQIFGQFCIGK